MWLKSATRFLSTLEHRMEDFLLSVLSVDLTKMLLRKGSSCARVLVLRTNRHGKCPIFPSTRRTLAVPTKLSYVLTLKAVKVEQPGSFSAILSSTFLVAYKLLSARLCRGVRMKSDESSCQPRSRTFLSRLTSSRRTLDSSWSTIQLAMIGLPHQLLLRRARDKTQLI